MASGIDILIPSFCGERYLPLCLIALSQSSYKNFKIYISVDGSLKNHNYITGLIEYLDLQVTISISNNRLGLAGNRLRLLEMGESNHILWLDDDVLVSENSLEHLVKHLGGLGKKFSIITGVGSNIMGYPKVACGLGLTLIDRNQLCNDPALNHEFGFNTGEDWLWTARIVYKTGLPISFVPVSIFHLGEYRKRKRYSRQWNSSMFSIYTSEAFFMENKEELELSFPIYNYMDY